MFAFVISEVLLTVESCKWKRHLGTNLKASHPLDSITQNLVQKLLEATEQLTIHSDVNSKIVYCLKVTLHHAFLYVSTVWLSSNCKRCSSGVLESFITCLPLM